jgi:hypothetical protein
MVLAIVFFSLGVLKGFSHDGVLNGPAEVSCQKAIFSGLGVVTKLKRAAHARVEPQLKPLEQEDIFDDAGNVDFLGYEQKALNNKSMVPVWMNVEPRNPLNDKSRETYFLTSPHCARRMVFFDKSGARWPFQKAIKEPTELCAVVDGKIDAPTCLSLLRFKTQDQSDVREFRDQNGNTVAFLVGEVDTQGKVSFVWEVDDALANDPYYVGCLVAALSWSVFATCPVSAGSSRSTRSWVDWAYGSGWKAGLGLGGAATLGAIIWQWGGKSWFRKPPPQP